MRWLRGLSGIVAGATAVLAAVVLGAAVIGVRKGFPGPGFAVVAWHVTAAVVVVAAQVYADRRRTAWVDCGVAVAVFAVTATLLWTQWWD
ncbi:hypothetical protein [Nocardia sp. NPDC050406]|uniref:hypothetical protein n=1 Tax=Nocardia sp. NPDC050406 TaxID=3364318 RepID=UPI003798997F